MRVSRYAEEKVSTLCVLSQSCVYVQVIGLSAKLALFYRCSCHYRYRQLVEDKKWLYRYCFAVMFICNFLAKMSDKAQITF